MIVLDDKYGIDVDDRNYTLVSARTVAKGKKEGNVVYSIVGYYGTLQGALKAFIDKMRIDSIKNADMGLLEALNIITESDRRAKSIIESAIPKVEVIV